jgi:CheY-like chemotaxis protein
MSARRNSSIEQPTAFLSYTRKDDEFFGGYITEFRKMLENAVHVVSGSQAFKVFQDIEGIVIGENWRKKLSQVIHQSSFFVPMVSPLFLNSRPCREEVEEFLAHERALDREDLILPVYFLLTAKLEKQEERERDPIAKELAARQIYDWREIAKLPLKEPAARQAVLDLAREIAEATERLGGTGEGHSGADGFAHGDAAPAAAGVAPESAASAEALSAGVAGDARLNELRPRQILWVDDQPDNNIWERRALESYGMRFALARDTDTAKGLLSGNDGFAAVISDLGRPGDSRAGITLLKWLRQGPKAAMPYFIYTSRRGAKGTPTAREPVPLGVTANPDELVELIVRALA